MMRLLQKFDKFDTNNQKIKVIKNRTLPCYKLFSHHLDLDQSTTGK
jgi:hypothetical protein